MQESDAKIEFIEDGKLFEKEDKIKRKILYIIIPFLFASLLLVVFSFNSAMQCTTSARQQTDDFFQVGNIIDKDGALTGKKFTTEQVYNYNLSECVKKTPIAERRLVSFLAGFLIETLLLFLFLWLVDKKDNVISLLRATIIAFYLSLIFSLGISVFIIGGIVGWGFASRVLGYGPMKTFLISFGAVAIYYGIILLLLKFI